MSKVSYKILWPNGQNEDHDIELPDDLEAEENSGIVYRATRALMAPIIGPDSHIEHVNVFWGWDGAEPEYTDMFIDEEGKLKGLRLNGPATRIYWNNTIVHQGKSAGEMMREGADPIVGPAVLFKQRIWY